jgi:hypothetical protein
MSSPVPSKLTFLALALGLGLRFIAPVSADTDALPYGPTGIIGPAGAPTRTCDAVPNCYVCTPSSCAPSGRWQSRIENAVPGDTILLRAGTYDPLGSIAMSSGTSSDPITVANFNNEAVTIVGGVVFESSHVRVEGLAIVEARDSYVIEIDSRTETPRQNIELRHLDIIGGTTEAIRVRGNVRDLVLADSLLDGGRDRHVMKVRCDDNTSTPSADSCSFFPENIVISNNVFSKVRSPFFPRSSRTESEDLLATELTGDLVITYNLFGQNDYEDCVDVKAQGRPGTSIVFSHNVVDSHHTGEFPSRSSGCRLEGILFHQFQTSGSTVIDGNWFVGGGNLIRATHFGTQLINNLFDETELKISADGVILGYNTWVNQSQLEFGDSTGNPTDLIIVNNIFDQTSFRGHGSYTATSNVRFQTTGAFECSGCPSGNPMLSGYQIREGSSAQDAASSAVTVATDIEGSARPHGAAPDIGAYESVAPGARP